MKQLALILSCLFPVTNMQAQGHASASWVVEKTDVAGGGPMRTAIRVKVDEGWHAYWQNPGQVGVPFSLETDFPEGWEAGEIQYPAPKRIAVSGLVSFSHEGEFFLPVTVTPPAGFKGPLPALKGTLKWLACDDDACVPGKAEITAQPEGEPGSVAEAYSKLPKPIPGSSLRVSTEGDAVSLTLTLPENSGVDPAACEVFPITRNIIDPTARIGFSKNAETPNSWNATTAKDEYFPEKTGTIAVLLVAADNSSFSVVTE
jgi:thiol:disulfide interchange protein DsbD